jgi:hypothetical protein
MRPSHFSHQITQSATPESFLWVFPELEENEVEKFEARWGTV